MNRIEFIEKSLNDIGISIYNEDKTTVKTIGEVAEELAKVWTDNPEYQGDIKDILLNK